jgi:hypothetical protein
MEVDVAAWKEELVRTGTVHPKTVCSPVEVPWARVIGDEPDRRVLVLADDSDVPPNRIDIVEWLSSALHDAERVLLSSSHRPSADYHLSVDPN